MLNSNATSLVERPLEINLKSMTWSQIRQQHFKLLIFDITIEKKPIWSSFFLSKPYNLKSSISFKYFLKEKEC